MSESQRKRARRTRTSTPKANPALSKGNSGKVSQSRTPSLDAKPAAASATPAPDSRRKASSSLTPQAPAQQPAESLQERLASGTAQNINQGNQSDQQAHPSVGQITINEANEKLSDPGIKTEGVQGPTGRLSGARAESSGAAEQKLAVASEHLGPYTKREKFFQEQENAGNLAFHYVQNDGLPQHSLWLIALKNIYSKQLPNMPKEYITRLVFDRRHRSVAVVKKDGSVVAGITYRPFHAQGFGEIAFCAVSANDQVKGYGSRVMSYTKQFAKEKDKLTYFLTYADNNAVTFFAKQGFTTEVTMPREGWHGYIKDYDGGTLMENILYEELNYLAIAQIISTQKAALHQKIAQYSNAHQVYPGIQHFNAEEPLRRDQIPGLVEAGWTAESEDPPFYKISVDGKFQEPTVELIGRFGKYAVTALQAHDDSAAFLQPVRGDEVPDYYDVIKDPMDFSKIERRLAQGKFYITLEIFEADVRKIFKNAKLYNAAETYWYKAANRLETYFNQYMASRVLYS